MFSIVAAGCWMFFGFHSCGQEQTVGSVSRPVSQAVRQAGFFIILMKSVTWECVALVISSCFACILRWVSELCGRYSDGDFDLDLD